MKKLVLIILLLQLFSSAGAQYVATPLVFADKAFRDGNYYEAAYYYKKAFDVLDRADPSMPYRSKGQKRPRTRAADPIYLAYQIGESYRLYYDFVPAAAWYRRVLDAGANQQYPLARLWHGVCLRTDQHFDEAISELENFIKNYSGDKKYLDIAQKELKDCRFAKKQYGSPLQIDITMMKGSFNLGGSDYAVSYGAREFYFTSSRIVNSQGKHLNNVFVSGKNDRDNFSMVTFPDEGAGKVVEYGTPSLCKSGTRMYFTRWYKKTEGQTVHEIAVSDLANGQWSKPRTLNAQVNVDAFDAQQPFVTPDGKKLLFVSNRPGGIGGDDIWQSDLNEQGDGVNAINLGAAINTPADEQAPWYDEATGKLAFSSKGLVGLGGFDLYVSYNHMGQWTKPKNMGYPINSAKDDLYYMPDPDDSHKFYLSSDRSSGCCLNIFEVYQKELSRDTIAQIAGRILDCDSAHLLAGVRVSLVDSVTRDRVSSVITDGHSPYMLAVLDFKNYQLGFEKSGYFTRFIPVKNAVEVEGDSARLNMDVCLKPFKIDKPIALKNILYDYNKATLRPESKIALDTLVSILHDNPKIRVELSSHTDSVGGDAYNLKLSQARAQSCVDYILSKGITEDRIYAMGYGKKKPIAPNSFPDGKDNPDGRQLNRRTEFKVKEAE